MLTMQIREKILNKIQVIYLLKKKEKKKKKEIEKFIFI